jgi:uroporphyrin-III C-methyltransferase/precorrin-2 dehydrogenase/sirohydrochlorin ferrochelatase
VRLTAHGLDPATPAVAVANATRPDETIVSGSIADIAEKVEAAALTGAVLLMIGRRLAEVDGGRETHTRHSLSGYA